MKYLNTAPQNTAFFEVYAKLSKSIKRSGVFSQIVSGLTEIGGIYAATYTTMVPVFPAYAMYIAGAVAIIGTIVIEFGLRELLPHSIDAILYKRFTGLYFPMTVAIWLLTVVLLTTSGYLSFRNSKVIVNQFTPEATAISTTAADSTHQAEELAAWGNYSSDTAQISAQFDKQLLAANSLADSKTKAARRELSNLYNRERRTDQSFATAKDRVRQKLADLEAEAAAQLAELEAAKAAAMTTAKERLNTSLAEIKSSYKGELAEVKAQNQTAQWDRETKVSQYGGGLGWFTIICLIIFSASVILDRIHKKGAGIVEKVELSQYDLNPSAWVEAFAAFRERFNYAIRSRIASFAERTPAAPISQPAAQLYDPSQLANIEVTLKIENSAADENNVIVIEPKRRLIGFNRDDERTATHTKKQSRTHEISCAIKGTPNDLELRQIKQRLKDYKKRLGKHEQKAIVQKRKKGEASKRTLAAIANNEQWVKHYAELLQQAEAQFKNLKK